MLSAIESFVRLFERLLIETRLPRPLCRADNDNHDIDEDERRWAAYR